MYTGLTIDDLTKSSELKKVCSNIQKNFIRGLISHQEYVECMLDVMAKWTDYAEDGVDYFVIREYVSEKIEEFRHITVKSGC